MWIDVSKTKRQEVFQADNTTYAKVLWLEEPCFIPRRKVLDLKESRQS